MCPVCIASATVIAGSVTTTGGAAALAIKVFRGKIFNSKKNESSIKPIKESEKEE